MSITICREPHATRYDNPNVQELRWVHKRAGGFHLGLYCHSCGQWLAWLPQNIATLAAAPPKPSYEEHEVRKHTITITVAFKMEMYADTPDLAKKVLRDDLTIALRTLMVRSEDMYIDSFAVTDVSHEV